MYDAIVVGARCAGAPTAMWLARHGRRVLVVDRATFPSDTISTHILWPHGAAILARWGLLDRLAATGLPPIARQITFDVGPFALHGSIPGANGGKGGFSPRRTVLDALLVDAAAEAGAEMREGFVVESLLFDGDTVAGIRGRSTHGPAVEERARIVIGADGIHSLVARAVGAPEYDTKPVAACGYYSYFSDVAQDDIELYIRERCAFGGMPTHDGQHILMVNWPAETFPAVRADIEGHVSRALDMAPDFGARMRAGTRQERWYGTAGVPGFFRRPYGDGWALVGDAAYNRDPITAQGMIDAFVDAEALADAIHRDLDDPPRLRSSLAGLEQTRNARVRPMYDFAFELARLEPPPPHLQALFAALRDQPAETNAFLSAITGATPIEAFLSEENLARVLGAAQAQS